MIGRGTPLVAASFFVLALAACATVGVSPASDEQAIRARSAEWLAAATARDVERVLAIHAPDAVVVLANMPPLTTSDAIRASWQGLFASPNFSLTWEPSRIIVARSRDVATEYGTYRLAFDGPQGRVNDSGSYTTVWRNVAGRWFVASDMVTSTQPLPAMPAASVVMEASAMEMMEARGVTWTDLVVPGFPAGAKLAVLHGNPAGTGDYTIRLQFPDGYEFPVHWHPGSEHLTVLSGSFHLGMGATADRSVLRTYAPGDFLYIPARMSHFGGARGETVIQLHGIGPFSIHLGTAP